MKPFRLSQRVNNVIKLDSHITRDALYALLQHRTSAVWVSDFYKRRNRERMVEMVRERLKTATNWEINQGRDLVKSTVDTIGMPLNVAKAKGELKTYYDEALARNRSWRAREASASSEHKENDDEEFLSPFDKLRLELDEAFDYGCVLGGMGYGDVAPARDEDKVDDANRRKRLAGLVRIMRRTADKGLIHVDEVAVMSPQRGIFSANIYLQNPHVGGELEIWPVHLGTKEETLEYALPLGLLSLEVGDPASQHALRTVFLRECPPLVIRPAEGDLVLLCVQRPHSVRGPIHGNKERFSAQTFISHGRGDEEARDVPLRIEA